MPALTVTAAGRVPAAVQPTARVFLLLGTASGVAAGILSVALPLYALQLGATPAQTGLLRAVSGLGLLLAVLPAGLCIDRFGARSVFLAGSLGAAVCLLGCAGATGPSLLALLMLGEAIGRGLQFGALAAAFLQVLPHIGLHRVGWHKGSVSLGISFLGPVLGGALLGWLPFAAVFVVAGALAVAANLPLRLVALPPRRASGSTGTLWDRMIATRLALATLLLQRDVRRCLAAEALVTATFAAFATFIVVLAVTERGLSPEATAWITGVEGAAYIATAFVAAGLLQRLPSSRAMSLGALLVIPALVGLAVATRLAQLLLFGAALGMGIGLLTLVITTRAGTLAGEKGRVTALFMIATSLGGAAGPAFAGAVAAGFGTPAVFLAFVPLFALLAAQGARAAHVSTSALTEAP
jgi:MFS family permease